MYRRSTTGSARARESGNQRTTSYNMPCVSVDRQLTFSDPKLLPINLGRRFIGPFTILRQINPATYKLQLPPEYRIHPTFHVSLLKPHHPSVFPSSEPGSDVAEPPLPLLLDDGAAYEVKEILDSRRRGSQLEYLVDWEGYGPVERSWIPRDDILDPNLLETFHSTYTHRPAPRGREFL
ncbi:hypothetical protein QTP70_007112 [Hemibagrus guttatus]|uniref:Chromo domain-containing protein n=1 Tax=Hemibagrus guttatus TaxID=175788 RepID=A0AAE0VDY2_9TELE|nr:hypothetical protein QTP70_007112 [Hemibagrus guttatus]